MLRLPQHVLLISLQRLYCLCRTLLGAIVTMRRSGRRNPFDRYTFLPLIWPWKFFSNLAFQIVHSVQFEWKTQRLTFGIAGSMEDKACKFTQHCFRFDWYNNFRVVKIYASESVIPRYHWKSSIHLVNLLFNNLQKELVFRFCRRGCNKHFSRPGVPQNPGCNWFSLFL